MPATGIVERYVNALPTCDEIDIEQISCMMDGGETESKRMAEKNHDGIEWYQVLKYKDEKLNIKHELDKDKRFGVRLKSSPTLDKLQRDITEKTGIGFERHDYPSTSDRYIDILDFHDISKIYHVSEDKVVTHFCQDALAWFARQPDMKITVIITPNLSERYGDVEGERLAWQWEVCYVLINDINT